MTFLIQFNIESWTGPFEITWIIQTIAIKLTGDLYEPTTSFTTSFMGTTNS